MEEAVDGIAQRPVIGDPKSGLASRIVHTPDVLTFIGRPDPLLLQVVIGVLLCVFLFGAIALSPRDGVFSLLLLGCLFLPLIAVLAVNAVRVRTSCVLDKAAGAVRIDERSYTRQIHERFALDQVAAATVRRLPAPPLAGGATTYGLFLQLPNVDYWLLSSTNEQTIQQDAWRVARFLDVPVDVQLDPADPPGRARTIASVGIMYVVPVVVATAVLVFVLDQLPRVEPSVVGLVAAVVISQIAAIIAYAYYRARRPLGG